MYYDKTAQILSALRGMLGEETFHRAFREYGRRWIGRHPYPYDFFNTIENVSKQDLGWFWTSWFFEAWSLDQAIASVKQEGDSVEITIRGSWARTDAGAARGHAREWARASASACR